MEFSKLVEATGLVQRPLRCASRKWGGIMGVKSQAGTAKKMKITAPSSRRARSSESDGRFFATVRRYHLGVWCLTAVDREWAAACARKRRL